MFNNSFNHNGTIHFNVEEWSCTDPDEFQFCRKVSDTEFEYIQLKDKEKVKDSLCAGRNALRYLNDETIPSDWYQDEICVTDYDAEELAEYLEPYGGILDGTTDETIINQLTCECIFEQDIVMSGLYE